MDSTPAHNDSGYNTTSSSSGVKRALRFPSCESTPSTSRPRSRKRKFEPYDLKSRKLSNIVEDKEKQELFHTFRSASLDNSLNDSCFNNSESDSSFICGNFQNSCATNDNKSVDFKLSSTLEKCTLDDYINESLHSAKKFKWDDEELSCSIKSNSAPGTPQRQEKDSDHSLRKYYSLDLTPTKNVNVKIGTPERLEILYPKLIEVKCPSKLKYEIKRLKPKPHRTRLFHCRDFVYLFTKVKKVDHVIKQIFSHLSDTDLVNVAKVSKLWKKSLETDHTALKRYKTHLKNITISKENIYHSFGTSSSFCVFSRSTATSHATRVQRSPPRSPSRENWTKFTKIAATLSGAQRLTKCDVCGRPAVLERGLARCSGPTCGYLWCVRCLHGSYTAPEELACVCSGPNSPLADRSNLEAVGPDTTTPPLYYLDHSSGYFSRSEVDKSFSFCDKPPRALADCNNSTLRRKLQLETNNNNINVLEHSALIQKVKTNLRAKKKHVVEPGSPQKIKMFAAGSKQSKKNLRRL